MDGPGGECHNAPMDDLESAARRAADRAGAIIRERWARQGEVAVKSTAIDLVTEVDRACEDAILDVLMSAFPDHGVLAEESGSHPGTEYQWIVDPLDGTTNFAHAYPQVSVSIALRRREQTELGIVHDPIRRETFFARRGQGSTLDGRALRVSSTEPLGAALLASGFPYDRREHADFYLGLFKAFMLRTQGIRRAGSAALDLCWTAAGRVDGFWELKLKPWDTSAGALIVEEAGGMVTDFHGRPFDPFRAETLASNGRIHAEMVAVLSALVPDSTEPSTSAP